MGLLQSSQIWGAENPNLVEGASLPPAKCTVWCAFSAVSIVSHLFIEENVSSECYGAFLGGTFLPVFERNRCDISGIFISTSLTMATCY
jgi:hypothetical protein